ncbi:hypothetical protein [Blastococcus sp. TF02A-35]|uniref:hypothetical protein n=1 Tax=Blastococcus sp. TF02A-35 TaxID=2559612 RepID=UPI0010732437|nr:hypothetical protein [Blastococcus sp. TF02A_35]TFV52501.1 hypothetical protein E4P43_05780 [Blastococcus sp. TF02A_35]
MTGSLFVTGSGAGSTGRELSGRGFAIGRAGDVAHAVARPVVDGLEASICGVLVVALAAADWPASGGGPHCAECARLAG